MKVQGDTEHRCPNCYSEVMQVMEEWICQKPCGFRSHDASPVAWAMLHTLIALTNLTEQLAKQYGVALPNSNITKNFNHFREY